MPAPATPPPAAADNEIGLDIITAAAGRMGLKLPADPGTKPAEAPADPVVENDETPAADDGAETPEDRAARLRQAEGEDDEAYDARLAEEGLTRDDLPAEDTPAAEPTDEEKRAAAQKARDEADLKKLPEPARKAAQAIIDKRIGKITAQAKARETELTAQLTDLQTQLAEAREGATDQPAKATVVETVHPLLLDPSEQAITAYQKGVEEFEDWAAEREDGYEPTEAELAKGYTPATKAQIRARLRTLQRERDKVVTEARAALSARATHEAEARKVLPALFDAKSPDYQAARTLLREQPELKRFPDYQLRVAEILLGRKALAALRAEKAKPTPAKPAAAPRASRAPGGGSAPKGGAFERRPAGADAPSAVTNAIKSPTVDNKRAAALAVLS